MPTYDYRCAACSHAFELIQRMRDPVKRACPKCRKRSLQRLIGTGAAILIGGSSSAPESHQESAGSASSSSSSTESKDTTTSTESDSKDSTPDAPEKNVSGSTSTPTHAAREHRGVGNLVDAAKRTRRENEASKKNLKKTTEKPKKTTKKSNAKSKKKSASAKSTRRTD